MMDRFKSTGRCNTTRGALCALLVAAAIPAFCQWVAVPSGTTSYLKDIFFLNDSVGYCVGGGDMYGFPNGEQAVVLHSLDGGSTWSTVLQDTGVAFTGVAAKGDTVVCFGRSMAQPCLVWASFNSGGTWQVDSLPLPGIRDPAFNGNSLLFLSNQDLVQLGLGSFTLDTLFIPNTVSIYGLDGERLYLMTTEKSIHSSTDGGLTWDTIPCFMADSLGIWTESYGEALFASGDTIAVKLTYNAVSTYTTDHGLSWTTFFSPFIAQVLFNSLDTMYGYHSAAQTGGITVSTDRGVSAVQQQQLGSRISRMFFLPETGKGWLCGENGMIFKTTNGGFSTRVQEHLVPAAWIIVQPNPARESCTLVVPENVVVREIELLDSTLKQVRTFPTKARVLGLSGIPAGAYWLRLETNKGHQDIRLIVSP